MNPVLACLLSSSLGLAVSLPALADTAFNCVAKTVVLYHLGAQWDQLEAELDGHLAFIAERLQSQEITSAGPLLSPLGAPAGGLSIYASVDLKKVQALVEHDPMIQHGVATYEAIRWNECH